MYGQMIFLPRLPRSFNGEKTVFPTKWSGKTWYPNVKEWIGPLPHIMYKNWLKVEQRVNVGAKITKLLEEKYRPRYIYDLGVGSGFFKIWHSGAQDKR